MLAVRFLGQQSVKDFSPKLAGIFAGRAGNGTHRRGGVCMQLKMFVLSGAALALWLTPLTALDKRIGWHKSMQGLSLCAAIACAVSAGNIARKLSEESEIEVIKERAIKADVMDEISTSVYVSQQQRQQEAELILTSSESDVEASRKSLEVIYGNGLQGCASTSDHPDYVIFLEVDKSMKAGKSATWIIENIFKMGGRKFSEGKEKLAKLLKQFGETEGENSDSWLGF